MEYRKLGSSGLEVSAFGLGAMTFGGQSSEEDSFRQLDLAVEAGINFIDTAENYPFPFDPATQGDSEVVVGRWIAQRKVRDKVVIATKAAAFGGFVHIRGDQRCLDRANLREAIDASLKRFNTDVIDLYQLHWSERVISTNFQPRFSNVKDRPEIVTIAETLEALGEAVKEGKVRAIGICNESPWGAMRYLAEADRRGLPRITSIQNGYSLLDRTFELGLAEVAMREELPLVGYSPLATGGLTGKYGSTPQPIAGSRSAAIPDYLKRLGARRLRAIEAYTAIAREHGMSLPHMALAFARQQPFVATTLLGASSAAQLTDNLAAKDLILSRDIIKQINAVHDADPNPV
ncbi:MAG TPA: aldo/keto reductase [Novosphingobium sp.]|nr:aldo/keto reductase [Novosphingobium sp.]